MQVKLHGEFVEITDDQAIRSHAITHGQMLVSTIPAKRRREAMERLVAGIYFFNIKLGAVCAELEATGEQSVSASYFQEMVQAMQAMLGLQPTRLEQPNDVDGTDGDAGATASAGAGTEGGDRGPGISLDTSVSGAVADRDTAASAIDGH